MPGHDTGWTTESQCTSAEALAEGHIHRCWSITEAWLAVEGESPHHAADMHYTCEPPADDTETHELPVRVVVKKVKGKCNQRTFWYWADGGQGPGGS